MRARFSEDDDFGGNRKGECGWVREPILGPPTFETQGIPPSRSISTLCLIEEEHL